MFNSFCKTLFHGRYAVEASSTSKSRFIRLFTLKYCSADSNPHSFTVSYLINSCGFSPECAVSLSKHVHFETPKKPDSVLAAFKNHGFSDSQISAVVSKYPRVLLSKPEKSILPKLQFFHSRGVSTDETAVVVARDPRILQRSLEKRIIPAFNFIKNFLQSDESTFACIKSYPCFLSSDLDNHVKNSMDVLRAGGVPEKYIVYLLQYQPRMFRYSNKLAKTVEVAKKMGFNPLRSRFVEAVHAMQAMSNSTWTRKLDVYKKWGWSEEDTLAAFRSRPRIMAMSEDKIMAVMDFFINKLGWDSSLLAKNPALLLYSFHTRTKRRASVMQFLFQKGLALRNIRTSAPYTYTESEFLRRFVHPYQKEAPQLLKIYKEKLDGGIQQL